MDDGGQFDQQSGDRWTLHSLRTRFRTLGEKRNATAALASPDTTIYAVWDSDDAFLPHHLSSIVSAILTVGEFAHVYTIPSMVYTMTNIIRLQPNTNLYHSSWGFTRSLFDHVHGYPFFDSGQDQYLRLRFESTPTAVLIDPLTLDPRPFYVYRWHDRADSFHVSDCGGESAGLYQAFASRPKPWHGRVAPKFERDWLSLIAMVQHG